MSRRTTPSSDEFRDDLDFDVLTWENELAREQARQARGRGTPPRRRARMNQDELRRQMALLAEDARQRSVGRRIAGITHTNTVTTVYKDGGEPEVYRTSSRLSTPNTV